MGSVYILQEEEEEKRKEKEQGAVPSAAHVFFICPSPAGHT